MLGVMNSCRVVDGEFRGGLLEREGGTEEESKLSEDVWKKRVLRLQVLKHPLQETVL
jgi:hypothetical protein